MTAGGEALARCSNESGDKTVVLPAGERYRSVKDGRGFQEGVGERWCWVVYVWWHPHLDRDVGVWRAQGQAVGEDLQENVD